MPSDFDALKEHLAQVLRERCDNTVQYGPLKGLRLLDASWWSSIDIPSKLLGTYETHVVEWMVGQSASRRTLIDVGAADGYLAVGALQAGIFDQAICFEISEDGRNRLRETAELNGVADRVDIRGEATAETLRTLAETAPEAALLIDIEGAEFSVLDDQNLKTLSRFPLIVELHDMFMPGLDGERDALLARAATHFDVRPLEPGPIWPSAYPLINDMPDEHRYLCFSEFRPRKMDWLELLPKAKPSAWKRLRAKLQAPHR